MHNSIKSLLLMAMVCALYQPVYSMQHTTAAQVKEEHEEVNLSSCEMFSVISFAMAPSLNALKLCLDKKGSHCEVPFPEVAEEIYNKSLSFLRNVGQLSNDEVDILFSKAASSDQHFGAIKKIITELQSVLTKAEKAIPLFLNRFSRYREAKKRIAYLLYSCKVYLSGLKEKKAAVATAAKEENFVDPTDYTYFQEPLF